MSPLRQALREATASDHERVDTVFASFDLGARDDYLAFLRAHARVLPALEEAVDPAALWPAWRARAPLLRDDLAALGEAAAPAASPIVPPGEAGRWGLLYVMEGSRLGGAMLAKRVGEGLPSRYLSAGHAAGSWQSFQAALEEKGANGGNQWVASAIESARQGFRLFEQAATLETGLLRDR